jgi:hypothetical protein
MTSEEAIEKAREIADAEGWSWRTPVAVSVRRRYYLVGPREIHVTTGAGSLGASVRVVFDAETGAVVQRGFIPR